MHTGEQVFSRPSLGSWLLYGLGSENQNLPGFVAIGPSGQDAGLWGSSFLPAANQGTRVDDLKRPIANLANPQLSAAGQRRQLDLVGQLNEQHRHQRESDSRLEARIASLELAFRMQMQAPEVWWSQPDGLKISPSGRPARPAAGPGGTACRRLPCAVHRARTASGRPRIPCRCQRLLLNLRYAKIVSVRRVPIAGAVRTRQPC